VDRVAVRRSPRGLGPQERREDEVLDSFQRHLRDRGIPSTLIERPDRITPDARTLPALTTDALLRLHGGTTMFLSCDVMGLAASNDHAQLPLVLHDRLHAAAVEQHQQITITGHPKHLQDVKAFTRKVTEAIRSGDPGPCSDGQVEASWQPADDEGRVDMVILLPSPSASLSEQIAATLRAPLSSKATKQAIPARRAGYGTCVLLDGIGPTGLRQGTHWLHDRAHTVELAVQQVLADVDHQLDHVWYLHRDGRWHLVFGAELGG
jgi:hypothetical protein